MVGLFEGMQSDYFNIFQTHGTASPFLCARYPKKRIRTAFGSNFVASLAEEGPSVANSQGYEAPNDARTARKASRRPTVAGMR